MRHEATLLPTGRLAPLVLSMIGANTRANLPAPWLAVSPRGELHILHTLEEVNTLVAAVRAHEDKKFNASDFKQMLGVINYTGGEHLVISG